VVVFDIDFGKLLKSLVSYMCRKCSRTFFPVRHCKVAEVCHPLIACMSFMVILLTVTSAEVTSRGNKLKLCGFEVWSPTLWQ